MLKKTSKKLTHTSQNERYLESIIDTVRESLLVLDKDLKVISANKTFYTKFKVNPEETIGRHIYELGNGQWNIAELKKLLEEILPKHNPFNDFRVEHDFPYLGTKVMLLNARQIKEKGKWKDRILLAIEDISNIDKDRRERDASVASEQKIAKELQNRLLQQSAVTKLGMLALTAREIKIVLDEAVKILKEVLQVDYSKVLEVLPDGEKVILRAGAGWNKDITVGKSTVDTGKNSQAGYTLLSNQPVVVKDLKTDKRFNGPPLLVSHGVVSGMSCVIYGNDGPYGVLGVHSKTYRDFDKEDVNFLQSVANIISLVISRKRDEDALRESEQRFKALADNMPTLAWMADADGGIYWYNSRWYEYTGTNEQQMLGWGWQSVHDLKVLPVVMERWKESLSSGKPFEMVFPLKSKEGNFRPFLTRVVPIRNEMGNIIQWFGTNTDISKQVELEKQKDQFLGIASHELKTPITSIKAYGQVLQTMFSRKNDQQAVGYMQKMDAQINKLTKLISDLLDVTKIQSGKLVFNDELFNFNDLVTEVVDSLQLTTDKHTILKKLVNGARVYGDRERISQVITNLVTNAIKYSPNAEKIVVSTVRKNSEVVLSVQDFGIGIPKPEQGKVFEQFFRASSANESTVSGLGLGLYISNEIIKRQGGKMWVKSTPGNGSTFSFSLPLSKSRN